ncbi:MAG: site-specific DNA-methyltransferase, partial [Actinobacteria bacterium]|nr:site-specific DNA-methyltransferase [Actinomycetota bacterium]
MRAATASTIGPKRTPRNGSGLVVSSRSTRRRWVARTEHWRVWAIVASSARQGVAVGTGARLRDGPTLSRPCDSPLPLRTSFGRLVAASVVRDRLSHPLGRVRTVVRAEREPGLGSPVNPGDLVTERRKTTATTAFGVGRRESHDASDFYARFTPPEISTDDTVNTVPNDLAPIHNRNSLEIAEVFPANSVALVVTSPPYFVGKEYELAVTGDPDTRSGVPSVPESYLEYLQMLHDVFRACVEVLEPGGRIAINVANLGRKPYRSLSADVISILQDDLGLLLRGEIIWQKAEGATGS